MVSLRKSRKLALLAAVGRTHRRSARLLELEERRRLEEAARVTAQDPKLSPTSEQVVGRKRGRKQKHVSEGVVSAVNEERFDSQLLDSVSNIGSSSRDINGTPLPNKKTLEYVIDMLQLMDSTGMLAMPHNLQDHEIEDNLREPGDLGTVRAKLHERYYSTLEDFERDIFSVTSKAKRHTQFETPLHNLASCIEQKAIDMFHTLRTQLSIEPHNLTWSREYACSKKKPRQLSINDEVVVESGGFGSSQWPMVSSKAAKGDEPMNPSSYWRPCSTKGNRIAKRTPNARYGVGVKRYKTKAIELPTESRDGKQPQCQPEDRRWTYLQQNHEQDLYTMVLQSPQMLSIGTKIPYEKSLMRFARSSGPIVENIARKQMEEQRATIMERIDRMNQVPLMPPMQSRPHMPNSEIDLSAFHLSQSTTSLSIAQGNTPLYNKKVETGYPHTNIYGPMGVGGLTSSIPNITDPTKIGDFSFPPPSIAASTGFSYVGTTHSYYPTSNNGCSSYPLGYKFFNVMPSTVVGNAGSSYHSNSLGEGISTGFCFGSRNLSYAPLINNATSVGHGYKLAMQNAPIDIYEPFKFGSCNNIIGTNSNKLPIELADGLKFLLSIEDSHLINSSTGSGNLNGVTSKDGSASLFLGEKKKAIVEAQPNPKSHSSSQSTFDLKLLHSCLGENPWGKDGISALKPWGSTIFSNNQSTFEVGSSSSHPVELNTLDLLGGQNPDLNLNL